MTEHADSREEAPAGGFFYVLQEPLRILFVDDDPIMREFALVHLQSGEAKVETAADGEEALKALDDWVFDIVLMDIDMPKLNGFDTLQTLRADPRTARLPIIMCTGREDVTAIDRAFQAGATSFLVKPINWRLLSYQIRYVMRTHRAEARLLEAQADTAEKLRLLAKSSAELLRLALRDGSPPLQQAAAAYGGEFSDVIARLG